MNEHCYRHVFSRVRGMLVAVHENARTTGAGTPGQARKRAARRASAPAARYGKPQSTGLRPVAWAALVVLSLVPGAPAHGQTLSLAASSLAPAGKRPIVDAAANGVPIVHIATPNAAGVSRNAFRDFNVKSNGLILNNSASVVQTRLGGWVSGNPQLGYVPARLILNEVTGTNQSVLRGTIEVAGRKADVIVANPNGLLCDGCSFINTTRATLTTGMPEVDVRGNLSGFDVTRGELKIGASGLHAANIEQLDLVARGIVLEGEVWAQNLRVLAGANQVLYATLSEAVLPTPQTGSGPAPRFAVDIKDLGGMYADQIYLVASEQGLGVNSSGRTAALQGNLQLSSNGDLTLKDTYSAASMRLASAANTTLTGLTQAAADVAITAGGALRQQGTLDVGGRLSVRARSLEHTGTSVQRGGAQPMQWRLEQDASNSGLLYSAGSLQFGAQHYTDSGGQLLAQSSLSVDVASLLAQGSVFSAHGVVGLRASDGDLTMSAAQVQSLSHLDLSAAGRIANDDGTWQAGQAIAVRANALKNTGAIVAGSDLNARVTRTLDNSVGQLGAAKTLTLAAGHLVSEGGLIAADRTVISADRIDNAAGTISAQTALRLRSAAADNAAGTWVSNGSLSFEGKTLANPEGHIVARGADVTAMALAVDRLDNSGGRIVSTHGAQQLVAREVINTEGVLSAATSGTWQSDKLSNRGGRVLAGSAATLHIGSLDNDGGQVASAGTLSIDAASVSNGTGALTATGAVRLRSATPVNSAGGTVSSASSLDVSAPGVDNTAGTLSAMDVRLDLGVGALVSDRGTVAGTRSLQIEAGSVRNAGGLVFAGGDLDLGRQEADLDNRGGTVQTGRRLNVAAAHLDNTGGRLIGATRLDVTTATGLDNTRGEIAAAEAGGVEIHAKGQAVSNQGGRIVSSGDLLLQAGVLSNDQGTVSAAGSAELTLDSLLNGRGTVQAGADLAISSTGAASSDAGQLLAGRDLTVHAREYTQANGAAVAAGRDIAFRVAQALDSLSTSSISAQGQVRLDVRTLNNDGAAIASNGSTTITATGAVSIRGGAMNALGDLLLSAASLDNAGGQIKAQGAVALALDQGSLVNDAGVISSGRTLRLDSGSASNLTGTLVGAQGAVFHAGTFDNSSGAVSSGGDLAIDTHGMVLVNTAGQLLAVGSLGLTAGVLANENGKVASNGDLSVAVGALDNRGGSIGTQGMLLLSAGTVDNSLGQIRSTSAMQWGSADAKNTDGFIATDGALSLSAASFDNTGGTLAAATHATLTFSRALQNDAGTIVASGLEVTAQGIGNRGGEIGSQTHLLLDSQSLTLDNASGKIQALGSAAVRAGGLSNAAGLLASGAALNVSALGAADNSGGQIAAGADLALSSGARALVNDGGRILADGSASIEAGDTSNRTGGLIAAGQSTLLNVASLVNDQGIVQAGVDLEIASSGAVDNARGRAVAGRDVRVAAASLGNDSGTIGANADARLRIVGATGNRAGTLQALGTLQIDSGNLDNTGGQALAGQALVVHAGALVNASAGMLSSDGTLQLTATSLDNRDASLSAGAQLTVDLGAGRFDNGRGRVAAGGEVTVSARDLSNALGAIGAQGGLQLRLSGALDNDGGVVVARDVAIETQAASSNRGGAIQAAAGLTLATHASTWDNSGGVLQAGANTSLMVGGLTNRAGLIAGGQSLRLVSTGAVDNTAAGRINADGTLTLDAGGSALANAGGRIVAQDRLHVTAGAVDNGAGGVMASNADASLRVAGLVNGNGTVQAAAALSVDASGSIQSTGGKLLSAGDLTLTAGSIGQDAGAVLAAGRDLVLQVQDAAINSGGSSITAQRNLTIGAASLNNDRGSVAGNGELRLVTIGTQSNRSGVVQSQGALVVSGAGLDNSAGEVISSDTLRLDTRGAALDNDGGAIASTTSLDLLAGATSNRAGVITSHATTLTTRALDNSGGLIGSQTALSIDTQEEALANSAGGTIAANTALTLRAGAVNNTGGLVNGGTSVDLAAGGALNNDSGQIVAGTQLSITAAQLSGNSSGRITAGASLGLDTGSGHTGNRDGLIAAVGDVRVAGAALDNTGGTIASTQSSLAIDTNGRTLTNDNGRLQAALAVSVDSGAARSFDGLISGCDVSLVTTALDNTGGQIVAARDLSARTLGLTNKAGLIQANRDIVLDTQGYALTNTDSGSSGGLVANGTLRLSSGSLDNRKGLISTGGAQSYAVSAWMDNSGGRIGAGGDVDLHAARLVNEGGLITTLGQLEVAANGSLNNQAGQLLAGTTVRVDASRVDNSAGGSMQADRIFLTADAVDNRGGTLGATTEVGITTQSLVNTSGGRVQSGGTAKIDAVSLSNDGGRIVADRRLQVITASTAPGGVMSSLDTLDLTIAGAYENTGDLLADKSMVLRASSITNSGRMKSGDTIEVASRGDIVNSGEISAVQTRVSAGGTLRNSGLIDGTDVTVTAGTVSNTGRIYGDWLALTAGGLTNDAGATVAARQTLTVRADRISNTDDALLYSLGDLTISGRGASHALSLQNIGATIEARGDVSIAAQTLDNLNAGVTTTTVTTVDTSSSLQIQPRNRTVRYDANVLGWDPTRKQGVGGYVIDSTVYPFAKFGSRPKTPAIMANCVLSGEDQVCSSSYFYTVNDPVWALFKVAPPDYSGLVAPVIADPRGGGCTFYDGGDAGTYSRNMSGACGVYWNAYDAYTAAYAQRTADAYGELNAAIEAFNVDLEARGFDWWYEYQVTRSTTMTPQVTSTKPARIIAGGDLVISGSGAKTNDASAIVAGGELRVSGSRIVNEARTGVETVTDEGRTRYRYTDYHGGFRDYTSVEHTDWTPYTEAPRQQTVTLAAASVLEYQADPSRARAVDTAAAARATQAGNTAPASGASADAGTGPRITAGTDSARVVGAASGAGRASGQTVSPQQIATGAQAVGPDQAPGAEGVSLAAADTVAPSVTDASASVSAVGVAAVDAASASPRSITAPVASMAAAPRPAGAGAGTATSGKQAQRLALAVTGFQAPGAKLFALHTAPGARYLVETDPRFTNRRSFVGSDYFLRQLQLDPERQMKRYGDGFAEQQLLSDQVMALTGRRFLSGYSDTEAEYTALMQAGVAFARRYQLTPGVALTAEQMALLSTDIVWLEAQDVALPGGGVERVLVPRLYLRSLVDGDLQANGALMSGKSVRLASAGQLVNSGTLSGESVTVQAQDILNSGSVRGRTIGLQASRDLQLLGGQIQGTGSDSVIQLGAGRDIVLNTTTQSSTAQTTTNSASRTAVDRVATIQGGSVTLEAARDLLVSGARVQADGPLLALAGRDIVLQSVQQDHRLDIDTGGRTAGRTGHVIEAQQTQQLTTFTAAGNLALVAQGNVQIQGTNLNAGGDALVQGRQISVQVALDRQRIDTQAVVPQAYTRVASDDQKVVGGQITAQGNIALIATQDIKLSGATVQAGGQAALQAGRDVTIEALTSRHASAREDYSTGGGLLSKTTSTSASSVEATRVEGSTVSGNTVLIKAGSDVRVAGSNVVADQELAIAAGRDLTLTTTEQTSSSQSSASRTKSGVFGGGGRLTLGSQSQSQANQTQTSEQVGSTVGSVGGNVILSAGNQYTQTGSAVLAPGGNVDIAARKVLIEAATDSSRGHHESHFKQTGVSAGVSSPLLNALQSASQVGEAAGKTQDPRMQALAAASAALSLGEAAGAAQQIAENPGRVGIGVNISLGSSRSDSRTDTTSTTAVSSQVNAGGHVTIRATGAGADSTLTVRGSDITAAGTTRLQADGAIDLEAARNTAEQTSRNSGSSGSIGIGFNVGGTSSGVGISASASKSRGSADGSDLSYTNTHVSGNQVQLQSGGDTTLRGAVVAGNQVTARVGGDLKIQSHQDTSTYDAKHQSVGGSVTVGAGISGSVNVSSARAQGDYASVTEQSGIKAGDGGFQVTVRGNTDLKGGVIASSQAAVDGGRNTLNTATLTASDIRNKDDYQASGYSVGLSTSSKPEDKTAPRLADPDAPAVNPKTGVGLTAGFGQASGGQGSTTQSGISQGTIILTDGGSVPSTLRRDVTTEQDTSGALSKAWSGAQLLQDVQAQVLITQKAVPQIAEFTARQMDAKAAELRKAGNEQEAQKYDEGGAYRIAAHTVLGALGGGLAGAAGAGAAAATAPALNDWQAEVQSRLQEGGLSAEAAKTVAQLVTGGAASALGAVASGGSTAGALAAGNVDFNNRQLHAVELSLAQKLAARSGGRYTAQQIADALRASGNLAYGEGITDGMLVANPGDPQSITDPGSAFTTFDGNTLVQVNRDGTMLDPSKLDPLLKAFIVANTGGANSPYSDLQPQVPAGPASTAPNGQRYELRVVNGQSFSVPVVDCPAASCQNTDNVARFGLSPADQAAVQAYEAAVEKETAKGVSTIALLGATAPLASTSIVANTALGTALSGTISAKDQTIDSGTVDAGKTAKDAAIGGAATAAALTGTALAVPALKIGGQALDDLLTAKVLSQAEVDALVAAHKAAKVQNNFYSEGASSTPAGLQTSAGFIPANPDKTTTVLGRYSPDMESAINYQMQAAKSEDFSARPGGFNVLNVDADKAAASPDFFEQYNRPFLDQAVARGDDIALATIPQKEDDVFYPNGQLRGSFAKELDYLVRKGIRPVNVSERQWQVIKSWFK